MWKMADVLRQIAPGPVVLPTNTHAPIYKLPSELPKPVTKARAVKREFVLRSYQARIVAEASKGNTIVVLPTGAGKTLIAAELILRTQGPAVFLVPTVLLVEQQAEAIRAWTNLDTRPYCGGVSLPPSFDVLVSTPKAFNVAQLDVVRAPHLQWSNLKMVIFDEVHHLLKEHPYRKLALELKSSGARPRVLGLTASYTYAVSNERVRMVLQRMCDELRVTRLETATDEELRECGYHARAASAEIPDMSLENEIPAGLLPYDQRKPHLMMQMFFKRVLKDEATLLASSLARCVLQMEVTMMENDPTFSPPIQTNLALKQWGANVHRLASLKSPALGFLYGQLEHWYEALRVLIVSWEEDEYAAVLYLRMLKCDTAAAIQAWPLPIGDFIRNFWTVVPTKFPRLDRLRQVLLEKKRKLPNFRGLLFVQQRITTHILEHFLANDPDLAPLFSTAVLYAFSSPATPSFSVSKAEAKARMEAFGIGNVNLLIATVVAEEGMDIPAANCVIRFDPMLNAVSLVQGRGRARQENSSFVVLRERHDLSAANLAAVERQQLALIRDFQPEGEKKKVTPEDTLIQQNRERCAKPTLSGVAGRSNAMEILQLFCTKTKVPLQCSYEQRPRDYGAIMSYDSILRNVTAYGLGRTKKEAASDAALQIVSSLRRQLHQSYG